jgi:hypothetical protein
MKPDLITVLIGTAPTFLGVLFMIWQMSRVQDQLNKRIDDMRDLLRAEIRAAISEARFR